MVNYDLGLFFAHGEGDCGAVGNGYTEENLSKQIVTKILNILKSKNLNVHTNIDSGYNNYKRNLTKEIRNENNQTYNSSCYGTNQHCTGSYIFHISSYRMKVGRYKIHQSFNSRIESFCRQYHTKTETYYAPFCSCNIKV